MTSPAAQAAAYSLAATPPLVLLEPPPGHSSRRRRTGSSSPAASASSSPPPSPTSASSASRKLSHSLEHAPHPLRSLRDRLPAVRSHLRLAGDRAGAALDPDCGGLDASSSTSLIPWETESVGDYAMSDAGFSHGSASPTSAAHPHKLRRGLLSPRWRGDESPGRQQPRFLRSHSSDGGARDDQGWEPSSGRRDSTTDDSDPALASPTRKHRFRRLISKGSKLNLLALNGRDDPEGVTSQEIFAPSLLTTAGLRDISSPVSRHLTLSTRRSPQTSSAAPVFELSPRELPRSVSYGDDASLLSGHGRGKAARVLGEEIVPSGKAALILGLEEKPPIQKRPSDASLLSPDSPGLRSDIWSSSSSSIARAAPDIRAPPTSRPTLAARPSFHHRQRSLSGPPTFASLDLAMTPPVAAPENGDVPILERPVAAVEAKAPPSKEAAAVSLGLVTPPPSPPQPFSSDANPNRSPTVSPRGYGSPNRVTPAASSTYQGSDGARPADPYRQTLESIRFPFPSPSPLESDIASAPASELPAVDLIPILSRSAGSANSPRSSNIPQRTLNGSQSFSASTVPRSPSVVNPVAPPPELNDDCHTRRTVDSGPAASSDVGHHPPASADSSPRGKAKRPSADWPAFPTGDSRAKPSRSNTLASVASLRTRVAQRSNALAALERATAAPSAFSAYTGSRAGSDGPGSRPPSRPPSCALPPLPSGVPAFPPPSTPPPSTPPPPAPRSGSASGQQELPTSQSFLDFDLSGDDEDEVDDVDELHPDSDSKEEWPAPLCAGASKPEQQLSAHYSPELGSKLSARLSSLPFRSDTPVTTWGEGDLFGRDEYDFPQEPQLARSHSSPLLFDTPVFRPMPAFGADRRGSAAFRARGRPGSKGSGEGRSVLSLSSSDEEDQDEDDWTSAFPRPPGT